MCCIGNCERLYEKVGLKVEFDQNIVSKCFITLNSLSLGGDGLHLWIVKDIKSLAISMHCI